MQVKNSWGGWSYWVDPMGLLISHRTSPTKILFGGFKYNYSKVEGHMHKFGQWKGQHRRIKVEKNGTWKKKKQFPFSPPEAWVLPFLLPRLPICHKHKTKKLFRQASSCWKTSKTLTLKLTIYFNLSISICWSIHFILTEFCHFLHTTTCA